MIISYKWLIKHLTADMRGNANIGFFEMQGVNESGKSANGSVAICFGGDEIKPMSEWTQENIDTYAETKRSDIEQLVIEQFEE